MRFRTTMLAAALMGVMLSTAGCERAQNRWAQKGAILGATAGDFVVTRTNGGRIVDVWKLRNAYVQSEDNSDGWLFRDGEGNVFNVSGDTKVIRIAAGRVVLWDQYVEYHQEFDQMSYEEKLARRGR